MGPALGVGRVLVLGRQAHRQVDPVEVRQQARLFQLGLLLLLLLVLLLLLLLLLVLVVAGGVADGILGPGAGGLDRAAAHLGEHLDAPAVEVAQIRSAKNFGDTWANTSGS